MLFNIFFHELCHINDDYHIRELFKCFIKESILKMDSFCLVHVLYYFLWIHIRPLMFFIFEISLFLIFL